MRENASNETRDTNYGRDDVVNVSCTCGILIRHARFRKLLARFCGNDPTFHGAMYTHCQITSDTFSDSNKSLCENCSNMLRSNKCYVKENIFISRETAVSMYNPHGEIRGKWDRWVKNFRLQLQVSSRSAIIIIRSLK